MFDKLEYNKQYYAAHKERMRQQTKEWYDNNKEHMREYWERTREKTRERQRRCYAKNKKVIKKYLKGFYLTKFNTLFYIARAKIILFHESSSIINAIILKKKIINLHGSVMGPYYKIRNKIYPKLINIPRININDWQKIKKNQLNKFYFGSMH